MASKDFLVHLDLNKQQLLNAALQILGTAPSSPVLGQIYWNSTDKTAYVWTGSSNTPNTNAGWLDLGDVHEKYNGTAQPATALSGANVISKITLENGHVTGVSTRALTASEIGAASATHTHAFGEITSLPAKTILANDTDGVSTAKALTVAQFLALLSITYGTQADLTIGTKTAKVRIVNTIPDAIGIIKSLMVSLVTFFFLVITSNSSCFALFDLPVINPIFIRF